MQQIHKAVTDSCHHTLFCSSWQGNPTAENAAYYAAAVAQRQSHARRPSYDQARLRILPVLLGFKNKMLPCRSGQMQDVFGRFRNGGLWTMIESLLIVTLCFQKRISSCNFINIYSMHPKEPLKPCTEHLGSINFILNWRIIGFGKLYKSPLKPLKSWNLNTKQCFRLSMLTLTTVRLEQ